jgi:predicted LPLAT superfamily acyltransferase
MGKKIEAKKRGNSLGVWFFSVLLRFFGLRGAYSLLNLVCIHYVLFDKDAVSAAMKYIKRRFPGCSYFEGRRHVYRLFISQGKQLVDRHAAVSGNIKFDVNPDVYDLIGQAVGAHRKGAILLTGHVGNWQTSMTLLEKLDKQLFIVMRPEDNPALVESLKVSNIDGKVNIISPEQELGGAVDIVNALSQGGIVFMMGDRKYDFNATETVFLRDKARFPHGAFRIAAAAGCPVVVWFSDKITDNLYNVEVKGVLKPHYDKDKSKNEQIKGWVQEFAALLEAYTEKHPYQCYLFHDVWDNEE